MSKTKRTKLRRPFYDSRLKPYKPMTIWEILGHTIFFFVAMAFSVAIVELIRYLIK